MNEISDGNPPVGYPTDKNYSSNVTFDTRLYELFGKQDEFVKAYIKVGRKFWHYDEEVLKWRKLTVTYIRANVMFYTFDDDESCEEHACFMNSIKCLSMRAAEIYPEEIAEILSVKYPNNDFAEITKVCKWDDCNGQITVKVIAKLINEEDIKKKKLVND